MFSTVAIHNRIKHNKPYRDNDERPPRSKTNPHRKKPMGPRVSYQQNQTNEEATEPSSKKNAFLVVKIIFGLALFTLVLVCTVFSKLTLVS